ncbi:MAG: ribosomal protein [Chloroflexi bacterium]|nr:ribosomal protein [Chloroflexota bacterium]MDB5076691.1 ribosomal protein [Chloroflexota bacterium]
MARVRIRYKKSMIGYNQRQRETIRTLGFSRLGSIIEREDSPSLRGMLHAVRHLVEVVEVVDEQSTGGRA